MEKEDKFVERLTYFSPTSFRIPKDVYTILEMDALHFGFRKNKRSNISGFLNQLLPALSNFRADWHEDILEHTNNPTLVYEMEKIVFSLTSAENSLFKPHYVTVPFRVNKAHYNDFLYIHDKQLSAFNLDFSGFVRSALIDYASRRLAIRERLLFYKHTKTLLSAVENKQECRFCTNDNNILWFVPASIIVSPYTGVNLILGLNRSKKYTISLKLSAVTHITVLDHVADFTPKEIAALQTALDKFIAEEKKRRQAD